MRAFLPLREVGIAGILYQPQCESAEFNRSQIRFVFKNYKELMKTKVLIGLALVLVPIFLLTAQYRKTHNKPADFRDAVMDSLKASSAGKEIAIPEPGMPQQDKAPDNAAKLSALGGLTLKMVSVKAKIERVELSLREIPRLLENKEGESIDNALRQLMADLEKFTAAAEGFDLQAGGAIAKTPKTPDTLATAKLLLADIGEFTDNEETIVAIRFKSLCKEYPAYEGRIQPLVEEYLIALEALGSAGEKIMEFSGPLESE